MTKRQTIRPSLDDERAAPGSMEDRFRKMKCLGIRAFLGTDAIVGKDRGGDWNGNRVRRSVVPGRTGSVGGSDL